MQTRENNLTIVNVCCKHIPVQYEHIVRIASWKWFIKPCLGNLILCCAWKGSIVQAHWGTLGGNGYAMFRTVLHSLSNYAHKTSNGQGRVSSLELCLCWCANFRVPMYIYICTCMQAYVHMHMYIYIYMYTGIRMCMLIHVMCILCNTNSWKPICNMCKASNNLWGGTVWRLLVVASDCFTTCYMCWLENNMWKRGCWWLLTMCLPPAICAELRTRCEGDHLDVAGGCLPSVTCAELRTRCEGDYWRLFTMCLPSAIRADVRIMRWDPFESCLRLPSICLHSTSNNSNNDSSWN